VSVSEVEQACRIAPVFLEGYGGRVVVVGPTTAGRFLSVVLEPVAAEAYYVVTAYPASRKARRRYVDAIGGSHSE
jgi:hypothetical protein